MLLVLLALIAMTGCSGGTATVTGTVKYNGQLLKGGNVTFVSTEGKPSKSASIQEDGTYTIVAVATGAVKVCVETESLNPGNRGDAPKYSPPPGQKNPYGKTKADTADLYQAIPESYSKPETTKLTYTVTGGKQTFPIELKTE